MNIVKKHNVSNCVDIVSGDGGFKDGCMEEGRLRYLDVNTLFVKQDANKQCVKLHMGIHWTLEGGNKVVITIDGNNKDSIEAIPHFIKKLEEVYD